MSASPQASVALSATREPSSVLTVSSFLFQDLFRYARQLHARNAFRSMKYIRQYSENYQAPRAASCVRRTYFLVARNC
jgi:hypothetical protein